MSYNSENNHCFNVNPIAGIDFRQRKHQNEGGVKRRKRDRDRSRWTRRATRVYLVRRNWIMYLLTAAVTRSKQSNPPPLRGKYMIINTAWASLTLVYNLTPNMQCMECNIYIYVVIKTDCSYLAPCLYKRKSLKLSSQQVCVHSREPLLFFKALYGKLKFVHNCPWRLCKNSIHKYYCLKNNQPWLIKKYLSFFVMI